MYKYMQMYNQDNYLVLVVGNFFLSASKLFFCSFVATWLCQYLRQCYWLILKKKQLKSRHWDSTQWTYSPFPSILLCKTKSYRIYVLAKLVFKGLRSILRVLLVWTTLPIVFGSHSLLSLVKDPMLSTGFSLFFNISYIKNHL